MIIISYALRWGYDWDHILTDAMFRGLTNWLGLFGLLFLWLQLQQVINGVFAEPVAGKTAMVARITQPYYIVAIGTVIVILAYVFAQAVDQRQFSLVRSLVASFLMLFATLTEKVLFVFEGLLYPHFSLYEAVPGHYFPSIVEFSSLAGTVSLCTLFFLVIVKLFPVVELHAVEDHHDEHEHEAVHDEEVTS